MLFYGQADWASRLGFYGACSIAPIQELRGGKDSRSRRLVWGAKAVRFEGHLGSVPACTVLILRQIRQFRRS